MKLAIYSDIHAEFLRDKDAAADPRTRFHLGEHLDPEADVVIVAGDLDATLANSLRRIGDELPGKRVIYVAGNHDYYSEPGNPQTMDEILTEGRSIAVELGIDFLENDSVTIDGVRFVGASLWTDMQTVGRGHQASKIAEARGRDGMNDYRNMKRWSTAHPGKRKAATPEQTIAMHEASRSYIEQLLTIPFVGPTVVVTHHAPHPASLDPKHAGKLDYCYASNLSSIFEGDDAPALWVHGHVHAARDYYLGPTWIVANPRGYQFGKNPETGNGFDPAKLISIETLDYKPPGM